MDIMEPINKIPVLNTYKKTGKYVLVAINEANRVPVKYSNNHETLIKELEKIISESVFKFTRLNLVEAYSEDLGITYKIILTNQLFK